MHFCWFVILKMVLFLSLGELVVGDEIIIKSLYIAMKNHVILSKRVCEVIAFLAKDGKHFCIVSTIVYVIIILQKNLENM